MFSFFLFDGLNNFAKNSLAWIQTLPNCKTPFLCRTRQRRRLSEAINSISSQDGSLLFGSVSQGLGTTKFTNLIG